MVRCRWIGLCWPCLPVNPAVLSPDRRNHTGFVAERHGGPRLWAFMPPSRLATRLRAKAECESEKQMIGGMQGAMPAGKARKRSQQARSLAERQLKGYCRGRLGNSNKPLQSRAVGRWRKRSKHRSMWRKSILAPYHENDPAHGRGPDEGRDGVDRCPEQNAGLPSRIDGDGPPAPVE